MSGIIGSGGRNNSKSAFGEARTTELRPILGIAAYHNILDDQMETAVSLTGTTGVADNKFQVSTGTTSGARAIIRTKRALIYRSGLGAAGRFTALFGAGTEDLDQFAGLFNNTDGYRVGYQGETFGILHQRGGQVEVRELTISAGASGTESLTIEVDGDSHTFNVSSGTADFNAAEITAELNDNIGGWVFAQVGATVVALAQVAANNEPGPRSGLFTFTNNSAGTCAGAWSTITVGTVVQRTFVPQSDWNGEKTPWLIPQNGNVYEIQIQYLGFGNVRISVEHPRTGQFILLHQIYWTNDNTNTSVNQPSFKIGYDIHSKGSTTDVTLQGGSVGLYVEGSDDPLVRMRGTDHVQVSVGTTRVNLLTIKNRTVYGGVINLSEVRIGKIFVSTVGVQGGIVTCHIDPEMSGVPTHQFQDEDNSIVEIDTTPSTYVANGTVLASFLVARDQSVEIDFKDLDLYLLPRESFVIMGSVPSGSSAGFLTSANWHEIK